MVVHDLLYSPFIVILVKAFWYIIWPRNEENIFVPSVDRIQLILISFINFLVVELLLWGLNCTAFIWVRGKKQDIVPIPKKLTVPLGKGNKICPQIAMKIYGGVYDRWHEKITDSVLLKFQGLEITYLFEGIREGFIMVFKVLLQLTLLLVSFY